ncbi:hypothetical protein [Aestuariibaculum suncheonense]|uniref:Uncharacterized protein n=1 Tax=Aestuariibaculum suncheonense TaxID=1028745 RepID=A0A8J6UE81_9FLAO|nr:hypothetical protein [Aestuariibaculum suncheonense]MBD0836882.1 hypothetical protein [Aestuariibaculum suncheonense]
MPLIVKRKKHLLTRVPLLTFLIIFIGLAPVIIGMIGASFTEYTTGEPCHEGNCGWMVLPWLGMFTIPLGFLLFVVFFIIVVIDSVPLFSNK